MLIKSIIATAILATTVAGGTVAVHKFADLQHADDAMLALASPDAIAAPDAQAKLDQAGRRLQKVAGVTQQRPAPQAHRWTSVGQWGQK